MRACDLATLQYACGYFMNELSSRRTQALSASVVVVARWAASILAGWLAGWRSPGNPSFFGRSFWTLL